MTSNPASPEYDAVIVLAHEMSRDGVLTEESSARADLAASIFKKATSACLVTCGWAYRQDSPIAVADAFKHYLVTTHGIDSKRIIAETHPRDTVGEAVFTRINVVTAKQARICVVTSSYHVTRAEKIFRFVYGSDCSIRVKGVPVDIDEAVLVRERASLEAFISTFTGVAEGAIKEIRLRLMERHPFYNGEVSARR